MKAIKTISLRLPRASKHRSVVGGVLALLVVGMRLAMAAAPDDDTQPQVIQFSGLSWTLKDSEGKRVGPGKNLFSKSSAWVDTNGHLHLKVRREKDDEGRVRWYAGEVICKTNLGGYGVYRWYLGSQIGADPNTVLGLFTWDNTSRDQHHREIDIELISTWGEIDSLRNAQYVVQPWDIPGRRKRWEMVVTNSLAQSTHAFTWRSNSVEFLSLVGHAKTPSEQSTKLQSWTFRRGDIPTPGNEQVRMNLWLLKPLSDDAPEPEVIITRFECEPEAGAPKVNPVIELSDVPDASLRPGLAGMASIAGKVSGVSAGSCKVVVYALAGGVWYVQPTTTNPAALVSENGHWATRTHGGEEYAALLVVVSYVPKPTISSLPEAKGEILSMVRKKPK